MKKIIIIDLTSNYTHAFINNESVISSSHQLYNLIKYLLKKYKIICYNKILNRIEIDNVEYLNYNNIYYDNIEKNSIILVQKFFPIDINILNKIIKNKIYFWIHDLIEDKIFLNNQHKFIDYFKENQENYKKFLNTIIIKKNIDFILPSKFLQYFKNYGITIDTNRINIIHNILYEYDFIKIKNKDIPINLCNIVYASVWEKGIWDILKLFDYVLTKNNNYKLILLFPTINIDINTYEELKKKIILKYGDKVNILGSLKKDEYCKIIKSSLCVITSKFSEIFGSVFAESIYLGTPVIGDINSGAVPEIVGSKYIIDYDNMELFYSKL